MCRRCFGNVLQVLLVYTSLKFLFKLPFDGINEIRSHCVFKEGIGSGGERKVGGITLERNYAGKVWKLSQSLKVNKTHLIK